jgi:hypothetical protein
MPMPCFVKTYHGQIYRVFTNESYKFVLLFFLNRHLSPLKPSFYQLIFEIEKCYVFCAVGTKSLNAMRSLINRNATATSRLPAGTA